MSTPQQSDATSKVIIPELELKSAPRKHKRKQRFIQRFSVYLEADAFAEFKARAAAEHHSISRLARNCILRAQRRALPVTVQTKVLDALEVAFVEVRKLQLGLSPSSQACAAIQRIAEALGIIRDSVRHVAKRPANLNRRGKI
jgi:hypothetical protein